MRATEARKVAAIFLRSTWQLHQDYMILKIMNSSGKMSKILWSQDHHLPEPNLTSTTICTLVPVSFLHCSPTVRISRSFTFIGSTYLPNSSFYHYRQGQNNWPAIRVLQSLRGGLSHHKISPSPTAGENTRFLMRTGDTDVIILTGHMKLILQQHSSCQVTVLFCTRTFRDYIDVNKLANWIGLDCCMGSMLLYTFTECDAIISFSFHG